MTDHNHRWVFLYADEAYMCDKCNIAISKWELLSHLGKDEHYSACLDRLADHYGKLSKNKNKKQGVTQNKIVHTTQQLKKSDST